MTASVVSFGFYMITLNLLLEDYTEISHKPAIITIENRCPRLELNEKGQSIGIPIIPDGIYLAAFANQFMSISSQYAALKDFGIQVVIFKFQLLALEQVLDMEKFLDLKTKDGKPVWNHSNG